MRAPDPRLDEIQAIPVEAVEAAAEWLPHSDDCEARPERDCTCWKQRVNLMREALEAAHPVLLAELRKAHEALEVAFDHGWREGEGIPTPSDPRTGELFHDQAATAAFNPYRAAVAAANGDEQ